MTAPTDQVPPEEEPRRDRLRWLVLAALAFVTVVCLAAAAVLVLTRGEGDPLDSLESLREEPAPAPEVEREELLSLGREFVVRFNTYGPEMLEEGRLPEYAGTSDLMSAKFAEVFDANIGYAEETVVDTGVGRSAEVAAVGIASQDADSAELLVAGTVRFSYPNPADEEQRIDSPPNKVRYQVSLVRIDGTWLVDDLDDIDDGLPSLADADVSQPTAPAEPTQPGETGGRQGGGRR